MRRFPAAILVLGLVCIGAPPSPAAEHGAAKPAKGEAEGGAPGLNVDMPYLMAPMQTGDGKLSGYAYIASRLTGSTVSATTAIREKIAFIQDAMVRDVNGARITKAGDPASVDTTALQARLLADARRVVGADKVVSIALVQVQIAPLRPKASPSTPPDDSAPPAPAAPAAHP